MARLPASFGRPEGVPRRRLWWVYATTALALSACSQPRAEPPASAGGFDTAAVRAALRRTSDSVAAALQRGDVEAVAAAYTADAVLLMPDAGPLEGRARIRETLAGLLGSVRVVEAVQEPAEVRVWGDEAYEWGRSRYAFAAPGQPPARQTGKYLLVWRRQPDGAWRIHRDASNYDGPAAPTASGPPAR